MSHLERPEQVNRAVREFCRAPDSRHAVGSDGVKSWRPGTEWRSTERTGASERKVPVMLVTDTRTGSMGVQPRGDRRHDLLPGGPHLDRDPVAVVVRAPVGGVVGRVAEVALGGEARVRDPLTVRCVDRLREGHEEHLVEPPRADDLAHGDDDLGLGTDAPQLDVANVDGSLLPLRDPGAGADADVSSRVVGRHEELVPTATAGEVEVSASPAASTPSPAIVLRILTMGPSLQIPRGVVRRKHSQCPNQATTRRGAAVDR